MCSLFLCDISSTSVGNMMQCVVLDGNPLDEDDDNLLDEVIPDLMDLVMM